MFCKQILEKIHADKEQTVEDALIEAAGNSSKYNVSLQIAIANCIVTALLT